MSALSEKIKAQFLLRKDITYLNFGAYGACPRPIFEAYQNFQRELEEEPTLFINELGPEYLKKSRIALGKYLNCSADDVVYVTSPSYAVNIIAKSLKIEAGDEVLTTNLEYGPCDKTWNYYCEQKGANYKRIQIQFPLESKEDFIAQFVKGITEKTKLIFISHITSSTGLRLPVEEICAIANERGILIYVDGAHAPGQLDIDLTTLGADIYTGACHKWMLTPKGSSFLFVKNSLQHLFDPLIISWGFKSPKPSHSIFLDNHQLQGTRDYSAFLTIPTAIDFMEQFHWKEVSAACKKLSQTNAQKFCDLMGTKSISPINDDFIGQLFSIPIDANIAGTLHDELYQKFQVQIPVSNHEGNFYLRYSIQGFNCQADLDKLYSALIELNLSTI
jgi:isopenicillin-N epimerase